VENCTKYLISQKGKEKAKKKEKKNHGPI